MKRQAEIYKVAGVDEDEPALNPAKKRKEAHLEEVSLSLCISVNGRDGDTDISQPESNPKDAKTNTEAGNGAGSTGTGSGAQPKTTSTKKNSAVYVTGLPDDIDADELRDFFRFLLGQSLRIALCSRLGVRSIFCHRIAFVCFE